MGVVIVTQIDSATGKPTDQKSTGGAAHLRLIASEVAIPESTAISAAASLAAGASGRDLYISPDLSNVNQTIIEVVSIAGTTPTIPITVTLDGVNYTSVSPAYYNVQTGALVSGVTSISAVGIYIIQQSFGAIKFRGLKAVLNGGAADVATSIRILHNWV